MGGKVFATGGGWDIKVFPSDEDGVDGDDTKLQHPLIVDGRGFSQTEVFREAIIRMSKTRKKKKKMKFGPHKFRITPLIPN